MTTNHSGKRSPAAFVIAILIAAAIAVINARQDGREELSVTASNASTTASPAPLDAPSPQNDEVTSASGNFLKELRSDVFESPAGLVYKSGSVDGHRLDHLMQHLEDDLSKPVHGVFDGTREEVLALLDEVWQISKTRGPPDVQIEQERGRTVVSVNLKRTVGYVGGQSGKRKQNPPCTKVRLVVEDRDVITAYPTN